MWIDQRILEMSDEYLRAAELRREVRGESLLLLKP